MLIIWCAAEPALIRKVFGPIVGQHRIKHVVEPNIDKLPILRKGDVLLSCGAKALATLVRHGLVPKNRSVTSLREKPIPHSKGMIFTTYDPTITEREYVKLPDVQWDIQLAIRQHQTGSHMPTLGNYRYVESLHETIDYVEREYARTGKPVRIACDTETTGLDEYREDGRVIAISFTTKIGKSDVLYFEHGEAPVEPPAWADDDELDYWQSLWVQINWLLTSPKVSLRGANWKFDSRWINKKWGIDCTNHKLDTLLVGSLLNENRSNSLKLHAKLFTTKGGYESGLEGYEMGELEKVPKMTLLPYVGADTDVTQEVADKETKELLKDKKLIDFYVKILHPSSKVFEKMERNGIYVDVPYYKELEAELVSEKARLEKEMKKLLTGKVRAKHAENLSLTRPKVLQDFMFSPIGLNLKPQMFTAKSGPSTSIDHLMMFKDDPRASEFIGLLQELGSANKTLSTYVRGFMKFLRSDGRFHPSFMLFKGGYGLDDKDSGADTGRTSAKDPAVQTIPKHTKWTKRLRRALIPPPGKTILQLDFSQGELRIAACLAEEPVMIEAYQNGMDLHAITAARLKGYSMDEFMLLPDDVRDELRSGGKAGNFGLIYGMMPPGFVEYAFSTYGVKLTLDEAIEARENFFSLYSRLPKWHEEYKNRTRMQGFMRSPLGRVRHLPMIHSRDREMRSQAERQCINSPVQSTLSDMMQLAMILIDKEYGHHDIQMFLMTHDSVALYVPIEEATIWAQRLKAVLDNLPLKKMFGWDHQLQFTSDAEIAQPDEEGVLSFANLKKFKMPAMATA